MSALATHMHVLLISGLTFAADTIPEDDDVVAGAWGAITFVGLFMALGVIGWSLNKHLRKAQDAKDAGAFGDEPARPSDSASEPNQPQQ